MDEVHYWSARAVAEAIRQRQVSSVELTRAQLARIESTDASLHAYAAVTAERALAEAGQADAEAAQGRFRSPLHGVPVAVKDLCDVSGLATRAGMPLRADHRADGDATVVRRLRQAGTVLLGKLELTEGAMGQHHPDIAAPCNPWSRAHWTGVSSSGSGVATAAGLCFGSLGSDTAGSIRFPAACCGVTGLKPTWGRVSRAGVFPLAESLDHIGPLTRSAADAAALLGVLAGGDERDPTALSAAVPDYLHGLDRGVRGLRIGVDPTFNETDVDPPARDAVTAAAVVLGDLGASVREIRFPAVEEVVGRTLVLLAAEAALGHAETFPSRADEYGPLRPVLELGHGLRGADVAAAQIARERFGGELAATFAADVDVILLPALATPAPTLEWIEAALADPEATPRLLRFTAPFDMSGTPTITVPGGFTADGLPVGFQLAGPRLSEGRLCRAAHAFQLATDWHTRHPPETAPG